MKIHTCKSGERLSEIAEKYGVTEENIIMSNIQGCEHPADGEELLILTPTRTYRLREDDSVERLCLRFGVRRGDILTSNPWILTDGLTSGRTINLKFDDKIYGMAPANGYLYPGFDEKRLSLALPYLTYVTVGCAAADEKSIRFYFDDSKIVPYLISKNKIPLIRIYDTAKKRDYKNQSMCDRYIEKIVDTATSRGYLGVVLSCDGIEDFQDFGEFLIGLRKAMIGCDLILILEVTKETPADICELADGNILFYPKYAMSPDISYDEAERDVYSGFATAAESAKCFIDISALAKYGNKYISTEDAIAYAREHGTTITANESSLISEFQDKKGGRYTFNSLKSIKRTLDIIEEFGFMGASFDIGRVPISYLLMYNMHFKTATHTYARAKEGCSKE